jgi:hypothetical protein
MAAIIGGVAKYQRLKIMASSKTSMAKMAKSNGALAQTSRAMYQSAAKIISRKAKMTIIM